MNTQPEIFYRQSWVKHFSYKRQISKSSNSKDLFFFLIKSQLRNTEKTQVKAAPHIKTMKTHYCIQPLCRQNASCFKPERH